MKQVLVNHTLWNRPKRMPQTCIRPSAIRPAWIRPAWIRLAMFVFAMLCLWMIDLNVANAHGDEQANVQVDAVAKPSKNARVNSQSQRQIKSTFTENEDTQCGNTKPIQVQFANGAGWAFCVDNRVRENLVLSNLRYVNVDGDPFSVLASAGISQLHVAYDDSNVTYNDVTQFGLGDGFMLDLSEADCPEGTILGNGGRAAICVTQIKSTSAHRTQNRRAQRESLNLFSVSQVGAYTYVLDWTLYDDGTIEPAVGATGALQRSSPIVEQPFGRVLSEDPDTQWLSHTHNYYWRLDFDLGESADDDIVVETRQRLDEDGFRVNTRETFSTEQARRIDPETYQSWRLYEFESDSNARGYELAPQHHGHRLERKEVEPYTEFDFFITIANDCERFASDNSLFNPECDNHVLEFANNEPLQNQDIVAWHRVSFHHVPRNEDQRHMHTHWDAFQITPINITAFTPSSANLTNQPPTVTNPSPIVASVGETIESKLIATDPDNDALHFHAAELPEGIELTPEGLFTGTPQLAGRYVVPVTVSDELSQRVVEQVFEITSAINNGGTNQSSSGFFGSVSMGWLLLLAWIVARRNHRAVTIST